MWTEEDEGARPGVEEREADADCECSAEGIWSGRGGPGARAALEGMGEMGETMDVVGGWVAPGTGAAAEEGGRSLSPFCVEPQQP